MTIKFSRNGQQFAEYPEEAVPGFIQSNVIFRTDHFWHEGIPGNAWTLVATRWPAASMAAPVPGASAGLTCRTCGQGALARRKVYRMSGPVVAIGYILLIPSVLGMLIGLLGLFSTCTSSSMTFEKIEKEARANLEAKAVPEAIIAKVVAGQPVAGEDLSALASEQRAAVQSAQMTISASKIGAGTAIAGGVSFGIIVMAFVGGLLGWLLVMKKAVLQCTSCGAIIPAS
jgi:hypothetical protein